MKKYKLVFNLFAKKQLNEAMDYYNEKRDELGDELWNEVIDKAKIIEQNPYQFQKSEFRTRKATLKRFPYRIFYRIKELLVEVIAIIHQSKDTKLVN